MHTKLLHGVGKGQESQADDPGGKGPNFEFGQLSSVQNGWLNGLHFHVSNKKCSVHSLHGLSTKRYPNTKALLFRDRNWPHLPSSWRASPAVGPMPNRQAHLGTPSCDCSLEGMSHSKGWVRWKLSKSHSLRSLGQLPDNSQPVEGLVACQDTNSHRPVPLGEANNGMADR